MANDALKTLHTALIDAGKGYRKAQEDAETPDLRRLFQAMTVLHHRAHAEVHALLVRLGEKPDDAGSFMATVHETVIAVRSAVTGLDRGALSSFASGEEHILETYDKAIRDNADNTFVIEPLARQRTELAGKIADMKRLAGP